MNYELSYDISAVYCCPLARFCKACVAKRNVENIFKEVAVQNLYATHRRSLSLSKCYKSARVTFPLFSESLSFFGKEGEDVGNIHNPRRCHWAEIFRPARPQMRLSAKWHFKSVRVTAKQNPCTVDASYNNHGNQEIL